MNDDGHFLKADMPAPVPGALSGGPFDGYLCFSIYSAGLAFNRLYKQVLDRFGLTYPQYLVMVALHQRDGQAVSELGEALFLESNTLTPLIKRLEAAGYVDRRRDRRDERVVRVSLSEAGKALAAEIGCVPLEVGSATGLTLDDAKDLGRRLDSLALALRGHGGD